MLVGKLPLADTEHHGKTLFRLLEDRPESLWWLSADINQDFQFMAANKILDSVCLKSWPCSI